MQDTTYTQFRNTEAGTLQDQPSPHEFRPANAHLIHLRHFYGTVNIWWLCSEGTQD